MGRAPCCDKANVKKGPWSPEEDATLKSYIHKHGTGGNWIALPSKIGLKRCGKSCRLRWLNYLRPNIKHGGFTEDEDNLICSLYVNIGSRWSIIAAQLPGRTDNDIKNYWNTRLKKKLFGKRSEKRCDRSLPPPFLVGYSDRDHPIVPLMPQIEAELCYDAHAYAARSLEGEYSRFEMDFPAYGSAAQPLSGLSSASPLGDISCFMYPYTNVGYYHQEMPQYYSGLFDEPRLLGFSQ